MRLHVREYCRLLKCYSAGFDKKSVNFLENLHSPAA